MTTPTIPAIETLYGGHRFRSRREARWAVFLNHLRIPFEYEPQGYVVDGKPYLPDFLIYPGTDQAMWFEVKGQYPTKSEIAKASGLARGTGTRTYLYWGQVEQPGPGLSEKITSWPAFFAPARVVPRWHDEHGWLSGESEAHEWEQGLPPTAFRFEPNEEGPRGRRSNFWWWMDCPHCGHITLKLHGNIGWCPSWPDFPETPPGHECGPWLSHETPRLQAAYRAARSARFEHGETPSAA